MEKGKFIVLDGSDGSGKQTQVALLEQSLKKEGKLVATMDFPQYENNFHGKLLRSVLQGNFGDFVGLDPYIASFLYTGDRFESAGKISDKLSSGEIVIADRFTTANMIHQGGKFNNPTERKKYLDWIYHLEYECLHLPKPDAIFFLKVPVEISVELLKDKKGKDLAEESIPYLKNSLACAEEIAQEYGWSVINCAPNGEMRSREDIHSEILNKVKEII